MDRRQFFVVAGAAMAATRLAACEEQRTASRGRGAEGRWDAVRARFLAAEDWIHMAGLLIATHPEPVRERIREHRRGLDVNPGAYVDDHFEDGEAEVRSAAADYLGVDAADVALTDSTTMAIALVYNGMAVRAGQELLTTEHDYFVTHEALAYKAARSGATVRRIRLYDDAASATAEEIVARLRQAIRSETRALALTWVHSGTGLKLPAREIAQLVAEVNAGRGDADRLLYCLDGVHGLAVEPDDLPELGCDFFMAGTHKWLFGPRGTGILWGAPRAQATVSPTIPTFSRQQGWGPRMTPGGFKAFEHQWALADAFRFQQELGKGDVAERIHQLARQTKEGLARMPHVRLHTPMDDALSAGIVCFDVQGMSPAGVVSRLRDRKIVASETPYTPAHARLAPGLLNSPEEVERTLAAVAEMG
ncbi:MAG TPA: aminotransferase class V-fold PLP-dependent enzyme [Longimicrobiales bacterium]